MKTISFVVTGPPTADIGAFVGVFDDAGNKVDVGWWEHDGEQWAYRMPVELVPRLVGAAGLPDAGGVRRAVKSSDLQSEDQGFESPTPHQQNDGLTARQRLQQKIKGAKKKEVAVPTEGVPIEVPAHWEKCPSCGKAFDPAKDELLDCGKCGESKCTAACLPDPTKPCLDCAALQVSSDDGGFDPAATPPSVFTPGFATTEAIGAKTGTAVDDDADGED